MVAMSPQPLNTVRPTGGGGAGTGAVSPSTSALIPTGAQSSRTPVTTQSFNGTSAQKAQLPKSKKRKPSRNVSRKRGSEYAPTQGHVRGYETGPQVHTSIQGGPKVSIRQSGASKQNLRPAKDEQYYSNFQQFQTQIPCEPSIN